MNHQQTAATPTLAPTSGAPGPSFVTETNDGPGGTCDVDWGSATTSQRCVRDADHAGIHIDGNGREFGWVPDEREPWGDGQTDSPAQFRPDLLDGPSAQTAELDGTEIFGRANLAGYTPMHSVICPNCHAVSGGTDPVQEPQHGSYCWRYPIARILRPSVPVVRAREVLTDYQERRRSGHLASWAAHCGTLSEVLAALLDEIDDEAGVQR